MLSLWTAEDFPHGKELKGAIERKTCLAGRRDDHRRIRSQFLKDFGLDSRD
jgi:hypothetical protein